MKKALRSSLILTAIISFCGCTQTLYTKDVAKSCQTKDQLMKQFGIPDIRRKVGADEEWIYNRDTLASVKQIKRDTINKIADSLRIGQNTDQSKYIKFIVDTNNNVIGYKMNGINTSKKVKMSAGTVILKILGSEIVVSLLVGVAIALTSKS
ncbi:hypothetical protein ACPPVU_14860 [Mucilaginibacter sp. McL0603]|uniref:hypothetical protein n=1 Tax=Mucilaginibacter sp. McL0603 TaxID=3415670 RepID=UPI003CEE1868